MGYSTGLYLSMNELEQLKKALPLGTLVRLDGKKELVMVVGWDLHPISQNTRVFVFPPVWNGRRNYWWVDYYKETNTFNSLTKIEL